MSMDEGARIRVLDHLKVKWAGRGCPMCQAGPWAIQQHYVHVALSDHADAVVDMARPVVLPSAAVVCQDCGYTALVNLVIAGLVGR